MINTGLHFQSGLEAPYKYVQGKDLLEFADKPGAFYRAGIQVEYTFRGVQQLYTNNKAPFRTIGMGAGFILPKTYTTNWFEVSDFGSLSVLKSRCSSLYVNASYIIRKPIQSWIIGYGLSGCFYRSKCTPLYTNAQEEVNPSFYKMSQYGLAPQVLVGYRPGRLILELNAQAQWLWNHNVLGYLKIENEAPFGHRLKSYFNYYFLFGIVVGCRLNNT